MTERRNVQETISPAGLEVAIDQIVTRELDNKINPIYKIASFEPNKDLVAELLHTILLGVQKYIWYDVRTNSSSKTVSGGKSFIEFH